MLSFVIFNMEILMKHYLFALIKKKFHWKIKLKIGAEDIVMEFLQSKSLTYRLKEKILSFNDFFILIDFTHFFNYMITNFYMIYIILILKTVFYLVYCFKLF